MKISKIILTIMLGTFVSGMVVSCGGDDPFEYNGPVPEGDVSGESTDNSWSSDPAAKGYEVPALRQGEDIYFVSHYAKLNNSGSEKGLNYCLEWDASAYHSRWVAFVFDNTNNAKRISRTNAWAEDPDLPANVRLSTSSYSGSGYTRGHICASADRLNSTEANNQTFYMSNMSPMLGNFNSIYWGEIEDLVRTWGRNCDSGDTLYVVKGATIDDRILGTIFLDNTLGNQVQMVIPKYYFIAVLSLSSKGIAKAIGFWLEHKDYGNSSAPFLKTMRRGAVRSIDELEELTHIDFFCNLPDWAEDIVESHYNISSWSGL